MVLLTSANALRLQHQTIRARHLLPADADAAIPAAPPAGAQQRVSPTKPVGATFPARRRASRIGE